MSMKFPYSQKLLRKSRDASCMELSHIDGKEYWETHDVYKKGVLYALKQSNLTRFHTIHDFCSGHGANIPYAIVRNKAKFGIAYNIFAPKSSKKLWSYYGRIAARMTYKIEDIYQEKYNLENNSLVLSIHPCGNLCHRIVDIALNNNTPIVIVPCCIGTKRDSLISKFDNIPAYTRWCIAVTEPLYKAGYYINVRKIRDRATPVNNIIIGIPP